MSAHKDEQQLHFSGSTSRLPQEVELRSPELGTSGKGTHGESKPNLLQEPNSDNREERHVQHTLSETSTQEEQAEEEKGKAAEATDQSEEPSSEDKGLSPESSGKGLLRQEFTSQAAGETSPSGQRAAEGEAEFAEGVVQHGGASYHRQTKKPRLVWTAELHSRFMNAVNHLGIKNAVPKTILQLMNVEGMTRENVASHLQKYRLYLKRISGVPPSSRLPLDVLSGSGHLFPYVHQPYDMPPHMVPPPAFPQPSAHLGQPYPGVPMQGPDVTGPALLASSPPSPAMGLPPSHIGEPGSHSPYRGAGGGNVGPSYSLPAQQPTSIPTGMGYTSQFIQYGQPSGPTLRQGMWEHMPGPGLIMGSGQGPGPGPGGPYRGPPGQLPSLGYAPVQHLGATGGPSQVSSLGVPALGSPTQATGALYHQPLSSQAGQSSTISSQPQQNLWPGEQSQGQQWSSEGEGSEPWKRWPDQGGGTPPKRW